MRPAAIAIAVCTVGCAIPRRPAKLPPSTQGYVAVLSGEMPGAISQVARHSWIVANVPGAALPRRRFELYQSGAEAFSYFGDGEVAVHAVIRYEAADLERVVACLEREQAAYDVEYRGHYWPIPGPNSNTIVDWMLRKCGIHAELPATAIGRDYRGLAGVSVTSLGTGLQLETWLVGLKVGLQEGVEVHLLDMAFGLHFWPPGITVPVNPGRIGFDDDGHLDARPQLEPGRQADGETLPRRYGITSLWLGARYARMMRPSPAAGLSDVGSATFSGRSAYGSTVGYAFGLDLEAGASAPPTFAYAARLYPAGITLMLDDDTFLAAYAGVASDGFTAHVPGALELPAELRLEVDLSEGVRAGVRGTVGWFPASAARRGGSVLSPLADELALSAFARIGRAPWCSCSGHQGRGYFVGLEWHEVERTAWVGLTFGVESDFGG